MSDRYCIRGCTRQHWATCENLTAAELAWKAEAVAAGEKYRGPCAGCAPSVCQDGSLICSHCFGRARHLLGEVGDILARIRSEGDPLKSGWNWDRVVIAGSSSEAQGPIGEDVVDATNAVLGACRYYAAGLAELSNDLEAMEWLGPLVLDRHKPDEHGVRERWSIQDAKDRWGVERRDPHAFVYPEDEEPEAAPESTPVREWNDPLLTIKQAAARREVSQRTVQRWVAKELLVPVAKHRDARGAVVLYFPASKIDAVDASLEEKRTRPKPSATAAAEHEKETA